MAVQIFNFDFKYLKTINIIVLFIFFLQRVDFQLKRKKVSYKIMTARSYLKAIHVSNALLCTRDGFDSYFLVGHTVLEQCL
jgi:hypothetical protein